jgi:hypothetical protein
METRTPGLRRKSLKDVAEAIRAMMETILHILSKDPGEKPVKKAKIG